MLSRTGCSSHILFTSINASKEGVLCFQIQRSMRIAASGTGGRSSVSGVSATLFGSTGFLGRYVTNRLGRSGSQVVVVSRSGDLSTRHLKIMGDLGQIIPMDFSLKDKETMIPFLERSNTVVNCMGRFWGTRNYTLDQVHVEGPKLIAELSKELGVETFIHVSALGASKNSPNAFLRSKGLGEEAVRKAFPDAIIVRPGLMLGQEEKFLNWHAQFHRFYGVCPMFYNDEALLSPVYVGDVASAIQRIALNPYDHYGKTFEIVGEKTYTQSGLLDLLIKASEIDPAIVNLSPLLSKLFGKFCDYIPDYFLLGDFSSERVGLFADDNVKSNEPGVLGLTDLGINPTPLEGISRSYLSMWRRGSPFAIDLSNKSIFKDNN